LWNVYPVCLGECNRYDIVYVFTYPGHFYPTSQPRAYALGVPLNALLLLTRRMVDFDAEIDNLTSIDSQEQQTLRGLLPSLCMIAARLLGHILIW
jgi:hypothetical protein